MAKEELGEVSDDDAETIGRLMAIVGVPQVGGHGVRKYDLASACPSYGAQPTPAQRARMALALLDDEAYDDNRFGAVDDCWRESVNLWCRPPHQAPRLPELDSIKCMWGVLAGLRKVAGSPKVDELDALVGVAISRYCPGLPSNPFGPGDATLDSLREKVASLLLSSSEPFPMPSSDRPANSEQAKVKYFEKLGETHERAKEWAGKEFEGALGKWYDADYAGDRVGAARAALKCLGGDRRQTWKWQGKEFVSAAQSWCMRQGSSAIGPEAAICRRHLDKRTHVKLVLDATAWLAGIRKRAGAPKKGSPEYAAQVEGRRMLRTARNRVGPMIKRRVVNPLNVTHYQPSGNGKLAFDPEQRSLMHETFGGPGGAGQLRALLVLRVVHAELGLVAPQQRDSRNIKNFYSPLSRLLENVETQPAACGLRADPPGIIKALQTVWLCSEDKTGQAITATFESVGKHHSVFQPQNVSRMPSVVDLERQLPASFGLSRVIQLAMLALDYLTSPFHAAERRFFDVEQYKYLHGALKPAEDEVQITDDEVLNEVRMTNSRLFKELSTGNLQHRVECLAKRLGYLPRPETACALCRQ